MRSDGVACVGAVVQDDAGRLLLVRRGREPGQGLWSVPGGKVESGESDAEATAREVREETALVVHVGELLGTLERPAPGGRWFTIRDYRAHLVEGCLAGDARAGDDAEAVGWFRAGELADDQLTPGLRAFLEEWQVW